MQVPSQSQIPAQAVPQSKKTEDWYRRTIDAFIEIANMNPANNNRRRELYEYYEAYNGIIQDDYYTHVLKPYGKTRQNFPAKLHRYNIIKPLINQLLGEKAKRAINYNTIVTNPDAQNRYLDTKKELLRDLLEREYADLLEQMQIDPAMEPGPEEQSNLQDIMERFEVEYNDERAIMGQNSLDYMYHYNEMYHKLQNGWKDFMIAGEVFSLKDVYHNEPHYEMLNPLDVDYDMDPDLEFVEDGEWGLVRQYMHISSVIDLYHDELTREEIGQLEEGIRNPNSDFYWDSRRFSDRDIARDRTIEVIRLFWKSRKKIGFVTWMEDGVLYEKQVEEGYKLNEELDEDVEWVWVNEVLQGHRINGTIYKRMHPFNVQRGSMDNPSRCKLPINGRLCSNRNASNVSLLAMMLPYQISYDIYKYRMEVSIAKSKDIIAQLDIDSIPEEFDMDTFMYYMDATGIAWTQSNKEGYTPNPAHRAVIDLTVKTIESYLKLLSSIVEEMERSVGINRQRQGHTGPYEGKGVTEQAIIQSSHITEDFFRKFAWFEQREFQGMLDLSQYAWVSGKKGTYFLQDSGMKILDVDGVEHANAEYSVFVVDAREESEKVQAARMLAQPMLQNGVSPSTVLSIFESTHFSTIRKKMREAEQMQERLMEAQKEAEQAAVQANTQMELEKMQMESLEKEKDRMNRIEVASITAGTKESDTRSKQEVERMKDETKKNIEDKKLKLEERRLMVEKALKREELAVRRKTEANRRR